MWICRVQPDSRDRHLIPCHVDAGPAAKVSSQDAEHKLNHPKRFAFFSSKPSHRRLLQEGCHQTTNKIRMPTAKAVPLGCPITPGTSNSFLMRDRKTIGRQGGFNFEKGSPTEDQPIALVRCGIEADHVDCLMLPTRMTRRCCPDSHVY